MTSSFTSNLSTATDAIALRLVHRARSPSDYPDYIKKFAADITRDVECLAENLAAAEIDPRLRLSLSLAKDALGVAVIDPRGNQIIDEWLIPVR